MGSVKIPQKVREQVYRRDGERCVACGRPFMLTIQHRVGKGAGGSRLFDGVEYLLTLCALCNTRLESDADFKDLGRERGWSMYRNRIGQDPTRVPVYYVPERCWWLLQPDATRIDYLDEPPF